MTIENITMKVRGRIRELPGHIAEKIAAGEIVDRPSSIVKELIENAIDSGADRIAVEIRNGGKSYIRVTDNGSGIPADDVDTAFKRHATSKISEEEDLDRIMTLGFRGEALASIAAVSNVEMITKTAESRTGVRIRISGGTIAEKADTGCPDGTTVIVTDLFYNVPARFKFLKSDAAESGMIIDLVSKLSLAYPKIRIRMINNGATLFSTSGTGDIYSNILTIHSREFGSELVHINHEDEFLKMSAYISPIGTTMSSKKFQIYFINGRYVASKIIDRAIMEAYRGKIAEGRYPAAFIFLWIDPQKLDVNIHPNKREVRFDDEVMISTMIEKIISRHLSIPDAIPTVDKARLFINDKVQRDIENQTKVDVNTLFETKRREELLNNVVFGREPATTTFSGSFDQQSRTAESQANYGASDVLGEKQNGFAIENLKITGSIFNTYITAQAEDCFYIIDQHAAHERIFYEKLIDNYRNETKHSQQILAPYLIEATFDEINSEEEWIAPIRDMGFDIGAFGPRSYIVKAVPVFMSIAESRIFIEDYLDHAHDERDFRDTARIDAIIMHACKSAVKAHDTLDIKEMEQLLEDLSKAREPLTCPHGRPVFLRLRKYDIEKMFKRQ